MRVWLCLAVIVAGVVLRVSVFGHHDDPRGDVLLDVGVARSLMAGEGFAAGFERGTAFAVGEGEVFPQDLADQHAPLWPLIGAGFATLFGVDPFTGLRSASFVAALLLLVMTWKLVDRLTESGVGAPDGLPALATALVALSFVAVDAAGNGSLYAAQALGVVLLVDLLGAARPSLLKLGVVLGALWLLNYQCLVLLPVPFVTLLLTARARGRTESTAVGRALGVGLGAVAVAVLCQAPWWWRNIELFGSATYSVNPLYLLYRLGVVPEIAVEATGPVARFPSEVPWLALMTGGVKSWLASNVLYLFVTGLFAWPVTMALATASSVPAFLRGVKVGDRRAVALIVTLVVLVAVSVVWPATKLRYLVPLTPLVVALGIHGLTLRSDKFAGWMRGAALMVWTALLVVTADDVMGTADEPKPERWYTLLVVGAIVYAIPLALRTLTREKRSVVASVSVAPWFILGVVPAALASMFAFGLVGLSLVDVQPRPQTAYFSTDFAPDYFGQHKEVIDEAHALTTKNVWELIEAEGGERVIAPIFFLAEDVPDLVRLPIATVTADGDEVLFAASLRYWLDQGYEYVVTPRELAPTDAREGALWLDGRLECGGVWSLAESSADVAYVWWRAVK